MPSPKPILALASISRPTAVMTVSYPWVTLARWYCVAPRYLPRPMVIILKSPDSMEPLKSVCGLTRLTTPIQSASEAIRSHHTGMPRASPAWTTSMLALSGQPMVASVIP